MTHERDAEADESSLSPEPGALSLADPAVSACPFGYYRSIRDHEPARLDPVMGYYWIARRDDVLLAAQDPARFSSNTDLQFRSSYRPRAQKLWDEAQISVPYTILTSDPPEHEDYRRFAMSIFTPKRVIEMKPYIQSVVDELIDSFIDRGEAEFAKEFAELLPATVVCDEYGFPRSDRERFKAWADSVLLLQTPGISEDEEVRLVENVVALFEYLKRHITAASRQGGGRVINDLATINRKDGSPYSLMERAWMAMTIFIGGVDTTVTMLSVAMHFLCARPELQDELRTDPGKIANFIDEILRLEPPVQSIVRRAKQEFEFHDRTIPAGADIMLCLASANRDERFWSEPDTFRLDRPNSRQHSSFGYGRHVCVGMHVARQELQIAISTILQRMQCIRFAQPANPPRPLGLPIFRAMPTMPIRFEPT